MMGFEVDRESHCIERHGNLDKLQIAQHLILYTTNRQTVTLVIFGAIKTRLVEAQFPLPSSIRFKVLRRTPPHAETAYKVEASIAVAATTAGKTRKTAAISTIAIF